MFVRICRASEIQDGELYRFDIGEKPLLVTRLGSKFFVSSSICTHEEADLSLGILSEGTVTCPLHRARFEIDSGRVIEGPDGDVPNSIPDLKVFNTKIENDDVLADL